MAGKKIFSIIEIALGILLVLCVFFNDRETSVSSSLGFDLNLKTAAIAIGIFYIIRSIVLMVTNLADPTSKSFLKTLLSFFEIVTSFVLIISGFCDGRETIIEKYFETEITVHHGFVFLGMLYASKAIFQLITEDNSVV